jgi:hypothetical protein
MAPSHHSEPLRIDVRQRLEVLDRAQRVVDLVSAVVDGRVMLLTVTRAAAIFGADDHVSALDRLFHEGEHVDPPVAVHAAMHPDHCGMAGRSALLERLEQVCRNVHVADAAPVGDFPELDDALACLAVAGLGLLPLPDVGLEVVIDGVILGAIADIEAAGSFFLHADGSTAPRRGGGRALRRRGGGRGLWRGGRRRPLGRGLNRGQGQNQREDQGPDCHRGLLR